MNVAPAPQTLVRDEIATPYKWRVDHIYPDWKAWEAGFAELESLTDAMETRQGSLADGPESLLSVFQLREEMEKLSHRVYWYASLTLDQDLRDNEVEGKKQRVSSLLSSASTAMSWMNPEILEIPWETVEAWLDQSEPLSVYRFALTDLFRQQRHVLEEPSERILSYASQLSRAPNDAYSMLTSADIKFPTIELSDGREVQLSHQRYYTLLNTEREQSDRAKAFAGLFGLFEENANTYAALYSGVCHRDWFLARSRKYESTLEAALDGNDIPVSVVENLIETTKRGTAPLREYFGLRREVLGLAKIHPYDGSVPLVHTDRKYPYAEAVDLTLASVARLGEDYQSRLRHGFADGWVDVYENEGKRSGAYSAPVYGVHPFVLMNYNDTMSDMFTLAHEMGHSMHTVLSHETQPFVYSDYTIFVAEVASTLNEALLLDLLLERTDNPQERVLLLQHAIDSMVGTFYTQVLFADFELSAHRCVENGDPITADSLGDMYFSLLRDYYQDSVELDDLYRVTWARIPHFFRSPYYVYQYATCFASAAKIKRDLETGGDAAIQRYLTLLSAGGNDHPMNQLRDAGVDLSQPQTVQAVVDQMSVLVKQLGDEIRRLA